MHRVVIAIPGVEDEQIDLMLLNQAAVFIDSVAHHDDRLDPDLIGFQEALRGESTDQVATLLEGRGYHLDYVQAYPVLTR